MPDIIQLLPDSVANQIAAGEVIQRPASVIKELVENSIDAGAASIKLIIKDAGRTLIQVIDDGSGMSETDARMCFERHATSKIRKADDLFSIRTKGFRGEAMASIAAIAHVELKTRKEAEELGSCILIEGSVVSSQEPCQCTKGTGISVKNLFYNVPARRNFLKSNQVELRHIIEEFQRVALPHPEIAFSLHHNENEIFRLEKGSFRQRIVGMFGNGHNERLVPVEESTNIVKLSGFVGKPEFARKTRGEQYFFVNGRFIKSPYLNHAVQAAFEELIPGENYPSYFLMMDTDPATIDINIHPTKTEIKFEDEKSVYAIIRSAVKQSLGKYHIAPSLDFEQELTFDVPYNTSREIKAPTIKVNPNYNPFSNEGNPAEAARSNNNLKHWEKLYPQQSNFETDFSVPGKEPLSSPAKEQPVQSSAQLEHANNETKKSYYQLHNTYIITSIKSAMVLIDQQRAHERVLYEHFMEAMEHQRGNSQQLLFPQTVTFNATDNALINELLIPLKAVGFDITPFSGDTFVINGVPAGVMENAVKEVLEGVLEHFKKGFSELKLGLSENFAISMARKLSIKKGKYLSMEEMHNLVDQLFACKMPYSSPNGKPTLIKLTLEELEKKFQK